VAVEQAAAASPTGNLARKVRAVFAGAGDVVQAAAALRMHTAERARSAQETTQGLGSSADAATLKEHRDMITRYKIKYYSTAMLPYGEISIIDEQVSFHVFLLTVSFVFFLVHILLSRCLFSIRNRHVLCRISILVLGYAFRLARNMLNSNPCTIFEAIACIIVVQVVIDSCQNKCLYEIQTNGVWGDAQLQGQFVAHLFGVCIKVVVMPEHSSARFHESIVHVFNGRGGNQKVCPFLPVLSCLLVA
jgi:hypothetical protein